MRPTTRRSARSLLVVEAVDSDEEAVAAANRVLYGLTSSILTGDTYRGFELAPQVLCGIVNVNSPTVNDDIHAPMGGVRDSGWGRTGPDSLADFSDVSGSTPTAASASTRSSRPSGLPQPNHRHPAMPGAPEAGEDALASCRLGRKGIHDLVTATDRANIVIVGGGLGRSRPCQSTRRIPSVRCCSILEAGRAYEVRRLSGRPPGCRTRPANPEHQWGYTARGGSGGSRDRRSPGQGARRLFGPQRDGGNAGPPERHPRLARSRPRGLDRRGG